MSPSISKKAKSRSAIQNLFDAIAKKHSAPYPEMVIAEHTGKSPFAARNWPARGIPVRYWQLIADLSGLSVQDVEKAHRVVRR